MKILKTPRRQAGQSLQESSYGVFIDRAIFPVSVAVAAGCLAVDEWIDYCFSVAPHPFVTTAMAAGVATWATIRIRRTIGTLKRIHAGRLRELAVADELERLRPMGYDVLHDLPDTRSDGSPCNIDHVTVGPAGVFVIETKHRSAPDPNSHYVDYDGSLLRLNGRDASHILGQARACANSVRQMLAGEGITTIPIRAVVLFPGWFIRGGSGAEVWVLAPKALAAWLKQEQTRTKTPVSPEMITKVITSLRRAYGV